MIYMCSLSLSLYDSGIYDEEYIDYVIALLHKCREYNLKVFMNPHQDTVRSMNDIRIDITAATNSLDNNSGLGIVVDQGILDGHICLQD